MQFNFTFIIFFYLTVCNGKRYDKHALFRGIPVTENHLKFFKNISQVYDVNIWKGPGLIHMPVEFTISPRDVEAFMEEADSKGIYLTTIIKDVQRAFDNQTVKTYIRRKMETFDWQSYFRLKDMYEWLQDLAKLYPEEVSLFSIGKTIQNREIIAVKLILKGSKLRSTVIVEGGIHAREWISHAFVTYLINELVHARTSENELLKQIAFTYEWYFIPVVNPDGYEYTHTHDRLWRKNLRDGHGIDLNRNFGAAFGTVGVSSNKKSEEYCGTSAFSEPESQALGQFIREKNVNIEYYLSFHSYGQYLVIPYAFSTRHFDNFDEMKKIGDVAAVLIKKRRGTLYRVGTAYDTVGYMAAGTSSCWVKKAFRVPFVATFELPDQGNYGFALPPEQILPICEETMDGLIEILKPQTANYSKLLGNSPDGNGRSKNALDGFVFIFNILLVLTFK